MMSKMDKTYEGFRIVIMGCAVGLDLLLYVSKYVWSQDVLHRGKHKLWLKSDRNVPTCSWFVARLKILSLTLPARKKHWAT